METTTRIKTAATRALLGATAIAAFASGSSAKAQTVMVMAGPLVMADVSSAGCTSRIDSRIPLGGAPSIATSKSSAILGGEMSALERMKLQQSQAYAARQAQRRAEVKPLQPASGGLRIDYSHCGNISATAPTDMPGFAPVTRRVRPGEFLASKRIPIGKTNLDSKWQSVRSETVPARLKAQFAGKQASKLDLIANVNSWVNREITFVEDRDLFGKNDYWAGARQTLRLRAGDCEDFALTKMQLLAAAGISRDDMYLTIARDTVRKADHALLIVRVDGKFVALDNSTDVLLDGALSHDYVPVLSFSENKSWIHAI